MKTTTVILIGITAIMILLDMIYPFAGTGLGEYKGQGTDINYYRTHPLEQTDAYHYPPVWLYQKFGAWPLLIITFFFIPYMIIQIGKTAGLTGNPLPHILFGSITLWYMVSVAIYAQIFWTAIILLIIQYINIQKEAVPC